MIFLVDICKYVLVSAYVTDGLVIKQPPVLVNTFIPFIMDEYELVVTPSKSAVLKVFIMINTLRKIFPLLAPPSGNFLLGLNQSYHSRPWWIKLLQLSVPLNQ